jgi:hypothetical protein
MAVTSSRTYDRTRRSLHGCAELLLAGPRFRETGDLRLRVLPHGIGTWANPLAALVGGELVANGTRVALDGLSVAQAADRAGLVPSSLTDVYDGGPGVAATDVVSLDADAVLVLEEALRIGDRALARFRPHAERTLWPEHFDVAIADDGVNYGVSPGDAHLEVPYAYVGPPGPVAGAFWNAPFGASRPVSDLGDATTTAAFFREGAELLTHQPGGPS